MSNQKDPKDFLYEGERLDDLQRDGMYIIQNPKWFCFGMDAVLLSAYAKVKEGEKCLDLGCGNGIIPLLLSGRTKGSSFTGLELQKDIAEMAKRSVAYNEKEDKVHIVQGDIREATSIFEAASFDVVTSNPPYMNQGHGLKNPNMPMAIARHQILCTLEDVIRQTANLLKPKGRFYMVHRPFRLAEIFVIMNSYRLEPKRMQLVFPFADKEPNMVLIEGVKDGNPMLKITPPLIVYRPDGTYTDELLALYGMTRK